MNREHFWLTEAEFARLEPLLPARDRTNHSAVRQQAVLPKHGTSLYPDARDVAEG